MPESADDQNGEGVDIADFHHDEVLFDVESTSESLYLQEQKETYVLH